MGPILERGPVSSEMARPIGAGKRRTEPPGSARFFLRGVPRADGIRHDDTLTAMAPLKYDEGQPIHRKNDCEAKKEEPRRLANVRRPNRVAKEQCKTQQKQVERRSDQATSHRCSL